SNGDAGSNIAFDLSGEAYVTGRSFATWGAPINAHAGNDDVFVARLDSSGALVWNTFLGSSNYDVSYGIAVNSAGNAYVTGYSYVTWGAPINALAGGSDAFVAKLDSSGALVWNTFLGSSYGDTGYNIAVDSSGEAYVTGRSYATWGTPINAHAGNDDAFVVRLDSNGALVWSTFLGSSNYDYGWGIAVDSSGNAYVTGYGYATWGSPINAHAGLFDAFVAKLTQDTTPPDVAMSSPSADPTNSSPIPVTVQFTETVTGFDASDLSAVNGTVSNFSVVDGDTYRFDLTPSAVGDVRVDIAGGAAQDSSGNPSAAAPQFIRRYDNVAPSVTAFTAPTSSTSLTIPISTFTASDNFAGVNGYMITESAAPPLVTDPGWSASAPATYSVPTDGMYALYPWVKDSAGNVSSVFGSPVNVMVDTTPPVVLSITRLDPNPTTGTSMNFAVTFSEPVTGVDTTDFLPLPTGTLSGATVSGLSGSGASYTVTVDIVSGAGDLSLSLSDDDSISDAAGNPLGGAGAGNGDFTGEAYTRYQPTTMNFASLGTYDGHIIESSETSTSGGTASSTGTTLNVGDGASDRQYRGFLHFNTATLPDGAVIVSISIRVKLLGVTGTNPFLTHGALQVDIRLPFFGTGMGLAASDFQSAPSVANVGFFNPTPLAGNWYNADLTSAAFPSLNLTGPTQFRLSFALDDNDDGGADYLRFYSGNSTTASYRPVLTVTYYVP
ncbi:MAG: Ig-like domain-containing protein, partial [Chloroflexota bacterium]